LTRTIAKTFQGRELEVTVSSFLSFKQMY